MHAKFYCCGTTPSQTAYELFSPPSYIYYTLLLKMSWCWNDTLWQVKWVCFCFSLSVLDYWASIRILSTVNQGDFGQIFTIFINIFIMMNSILNFIWGLVIPQSHLLYGGRRTPKSSDSCGCRRNSAVATGPPYGESLCFTGSRGGRRIIARSNNFFHFYVRRRNLTRRSHAVDASTATVRRPCVCRAAVLRLYDFWEHHGHRTVPLRAPCVCLNICHKNYGCHRDALLKGRRAAAVFLSP